MALKQNDVQIRGLKTKQKIFRAVLNLVLFFKSTVQKKYRTKICDFTVALKKRMCFHATLCFAVERLVPKHILKHFTSRLRSAVFVNGPGCPCSRHLFLCFLFLVFVFPAA